MRPDNNVSYNIAARIMAMVAPTSAATALQV
jgi:hypothetical protein